MAVNIELLEQIIKENQDNLEFSLLIDDKVFSMSDVSVTNSPTPVNSPTTRGGVYFSDKFAYKLKGTVNDLSIIPLLTKTMLGPNTEFGEIKITTTLPSNKKNIAIFANLTNSVQGPSKIVLNLIIIRLE